MHEDSRKLKVPLNFISERSVNILRVISSLDPRNGGTIEGARRFDQKFADLGVSVEVVCLDSPNQSHFLTNYPATVHALGPSSGTYQFNAKLIPWLKANGPRFDVVIVDGLWQYHSFAVWRALRGTGVPYFVFAHGMLDPWFKRTYPMKHLKKWLYWPWAEYRVLRDAQSVIFTCEEERLSARKSFWLYRCNEVVTEFGTSAPPNDSEGLREHFLRKHAQLRGKRIFLFLSRIQEKKGCDLLVDAFAKVACNDLDIHLVMAGPDQTGLIANLKDQAARLGISDRITWTGMLQGDDKWGAFYSAEVFCLPSHQENFGIVVAEALACGKPVLISNKVNIWREIAMDGAGIVEDDSLDGTSKALEQWLALTPESKQQMQQSARHCFESRFHIDQVAQSLINILQVYTAPKAPRGGVESIADRCA